MNGGGVEQVGATQAVNDLLLQSVNGKLHFFPGWEPGASVSFSHIRTPGAFLVAASRSATGVVSGVSILSEVGGVCKIADGGGLKKPSVKTATGTVVVVACDAEQGYCSFETTANTTYELTL
jgi:alpha-L-fucosidase 2